MPTSLGRISQPNASLPVYLAKRYITSAEILSAFTVFPVIIPAVTGYMIHPFLGHWYREPGTAYTLNAANGLFLRSTDSGGGALLHTFDASILSQTIGFTVISSGPSGSGTGLTAAMFSSTYLNAPMIFNIAGGQPTVGTGGIYFSVFYHLLPGGVF